MSQQLNANGASSSLQDDLPGATLAEPSRHTPTSSNDKDEDGDEDENDSYSSSSLSECTSEDEDWQPGNSSTPCMTPTFAKTARPTSSRGTGLPDKAQSGRVLWTKAEDRIIIASVKKHGQSWVKVKADLDRAGGFSRASLAIAQRFKRLALHAAEKRKAAAAATAQGSASDSAALDQKKPRTFKTTKAAPFNLVWKPQQQVPWTKEEEVELAAIGKRSKRPMDLFPAFLKVFPSTIRTPGAVQVKWRKMSEGRRGGQLMGKSSASGSGSQQQRASVVESSASQAPPSYGSASATSRTPLATAQAASGQPRQSALAPFAIPSASQASSSTAPRGPAGHEPRHQASEPTATSFDLSLEEDEVCGHAFSAAEDEGIDFTFAAHSPPSREQQEPVSPIADYTITVTNNGLSIQNLPPHYHLLILSPTQYRVVGPNQQQQQHFHAPFVFKVAADASIKGVTLPQGTTTGITMQPVPSEAGVSGDGQREGREWCVETKYTCADGYEVTFKSLKG